MSGVVIEATNSLDGKTYYASIVPKRQVIEYWLAPTLSPGGMEPQSALVTLKATATSRKSTFAMSNPPLLFVCYGIGRLEFDGFCALVLQILSTCDLSASTSVPNTQAIDELCARHGARIKANFAPRGSPGRYRFSCCSTATPPQGVIRACFEKGRGYLAPHSTTSSARISRAGGIVSPSAFAVLRLMTRSYVTGFSTGSSPGWEPLRILPTKAAARRLIATRFGP
jgi:hypothetical protein